MKILCKEIVRKILEEVPEARGNDNILFSEFVKGYCPEIAPELIAPVAIAFSEWKGFSFESLRRSRQKIQQEHPELKPDARIVKNRELLQERILTELYKR